MIYLPVSHNKIPIIGLGTYKIKGFDLCYKVVEKALLSGYRLIDTAQVYKNEKDLGESFKILMPKFNIKREEIFLVTKIATYNHADKCYDSILRSLEDLGVDYIDMVLIHWPGVKGFKLDDKRNFEFRKQTYQELERAFNDGIIKSIGLSNYTIRHLEEVFSYCSIRPQLLQCEFHPLLIQKDLVEFCQQKSMVFQAYSSLGTSDLVSTKKLQESETITNLANKYSKKPAQILLKWAVQQNIAVIPKSTNEAHLKENINIFDFVLNELDLLSINKMNENLHLCWNPETVF